MTTYNCRRCGYQFQNKAHYKNHTKNKYICKLVLEDIIPKEDNYLEVINPFQCNICNTQIKLKYDYNKHIKKCIEKQQNDNKEDKENKEITINNIQNIQNITINNTTINNTINIYVNDFKDTEYDHINEKQSLRYISSNMDAYPKLIQDIHFNAEHPENHNMYISNFKDKTARYKNQGKWFTTSGNEFVDDLIVNYDFKFFKKYEDDPKTTHTYQKFITITEPKEAKEKIKNQIFTLMYNNKDMVLETEENLKNQTEQIQQTEEIETKPQQKKLKIRTKPKV